ncbi:hypothetical protein Cenrod_0300 [Candidatus Symbiobacter mobilis CR]|uniref:Uncharacterized protein n=1 Tax=Candidatus Symbiobacter mobilis CR TaxID=946483 RepID=U5N8D1_9BURK|nr:hypothetical protein Cenrod_0300 [Candidatus Symbiobacter mobilis CR]
MLVVCRLYGYRIVTSWVARSAWLTGLHPPNIPRMQRGWLPDAWQEGGTISRSFLPFFPLLLPLCLALKRDSRTPHTPLVAAHG